MATTGRVWLVGAGPGAADLITLRALRALEGADCVLYDKLVNAEVLSHVKTGCELIYVGKEPGKPCRSQDEINALLVDAGRRHQRVVRLKGGDPFVFGRGGEEALALRAAGIDFEVVPGITSAISAPAHAGIPVTHRKVACSFAVITGHEAPGKDVSQVDWRSFKGVDTLVVLMGVSMRQTIARELLAGGRRADEPVAFIENGTTPSQRVITATLGQVAQAPPHVESPAVMVVGDVVSLGDQLAWFTPSEADDAPTPRAAHAQSR